MSYFCDTMGIGISKEALADQLYEVCETLKSDESNLFVQGLENLQKELLGTPLRKMKPSSLHVGVNQLHVHSNPDKEVGNARVQSGLI